MKANLSEEQAMFTQVQRMIGGTAATVLVFGLTGLAQAASPGHHNPTHSLPAAVRSNPQQPVSPAARPAPKFDPHHMPGWDWKYLYPEVYHSIHRYWPPPQPDKQHMPGWDWKYMYPYVYYSTHGYWPYPVAPGNPYYLPVPYPVGIGSPYGVGAAPVLSIDQPDFAGYGALPTTSDRPQDPGLAPAPYPTGPIQTPPANGAIIIVRLPDGAAQVSFDGREPSGMGSTRYYAAPNLQPGQSYTYTVTVTGTGSSQPEVRRIGVKAGQTTVVDFTKPADR
jgi:uncharacterized protein (TIGR03000 family)